MPHYKFMFDDNGMLYAHNLKGKDATLTIKRVAAGKVIGEKARETKKPIVEFEETDRKFVLNKTNGKIIAAMYGTDADKWTGKRVTLYPTTTNMGGEVVECIRARQTVPAESKETK